MASFNPAWLLLGLVMSSMGCYATASGHADADYVEVETVPPRIEVYPSYVYRGRTTYYVDGRWYYRHGPRWVYYREEPPELYRHRHYVERAPRAPQRAPHRPHRAPPADHRDDDHDHGRRDHGRRDHDHHDRD